jgi:hypothetical protein
MPDGNPPPFTPSSDDQLLCEILVALLDQCVADRHLEIGERAAAEYAVAGWLHFVSRMAPLIVDRLTSSPIAPGSLLEGVLQQRGAAPGPALDRLVLAIAARPGAALERLGLALGDLAKGKIAKMFIPMPRTADKLDKTGKKRGKRPPVAAKVQQIRDEVAGAIQLLHEGGNTLDAAAKTAAHELRNHPILADVKGQHWRTIRKWREIQPGGGVATHYTAFLKMAREIVKAKGGTAADLTTIAIGQLRRLPKP